MNIKIMNKSIIILIIITIFGTCFLPSGIGILNLKEPEFVENLDNLNIANEGSEYWALLVAVGEYADDPQQNRPLMLEEVDDLYDVLLQSEIWSEDHIKVIKGKDATVSNIISGLRWLDKMEDEEDFSLVYLTTHGCPVGFDIPPFDEEDGTDEMLISYWGFAYPTSFIWDDELNFLLNRLESQGVCLIVDSCYAGGFNDPPNWNLLNIFPSPRGENIISSKEWQEGFLEDVRGQNRVVLTASCEDELSYSGGFAPYLIDGLRKFADKNNDYIISAEEAFNYTEPRTYRQTPTIYDGYAGELPLIYLTNTKKSNDDNIIDSLLNIDSSSENSIICGFVEDVESNNPIENALINIRGRDNQWEFFENETTTNSNGFFSINVPSSRCTLTVYADEYCGDQIRNIEIDENEIMWINISLYPRPPENSVICGYINEDETENPINNANVDLYWQGEFDQFYMNETLSGSDGFYSINVASGEIDLEIDANGYFQDDIDDLVILDYETYWFNFSLIPRPKENSVVCGYITDNETGDPINYVRIDFEWLDIETGYRYDNETQTDVSGFFKIDIAAGEVYHDIRSQNYYYYNPYRLDCQEGKVLWMNITLEEEPIEIDIGKPLQALYINNNRIIPYNKIRIIGNIDIEAIVNYDWFGYTEVEKIEFYIDSELKETVYSEPYIWSWNERKIGKHTIKVIAYDIEGKSASKEIEVRKLL
ncbi:MAG: hypothetical protein AYK22_07030 [Thermoplasmatales archaeon SG8-52-3]|nr:MAG: hypothetical protein AYK22_07030 [Thermoplasmatales archaeon SG8-52-3]